MLRRIIYNIELLMREEKQKGRFELEMEYREIQYVSKPISKIIFGCANAKMMQRPGIFQKKEVFNLLDGALDAGINTFDTAENYGDSELVLGKWMKQHKTRDKIIIMTKGCHPHGMPRVTVEALKEDLEQSFRRLGTEYIDIYLLHRDHPDADVKAIVEVLNEYYQAGRIGAFGASNWTHERIEEANKYAMSKDLIPFSVSSPNFGPAVQIEDPWGGGCVSISGEEGVQARKWYAENNMPVFAYSCLGRGLFSGKVKSADLEQGREQLDKYAIKGYWCSENLERLARIERIAKERRCSVSQVALAWILQQDMQTFSIVTISGVGRIKENVEAVNLKLSKEEMEEISQM